MKNIERAKVLVEEDKVDKVLDGIEETLEWLEEKNDVELTEEAKDDIKDGILSRVVESEGEESEYSELLGFEKTPENWIDEFAEDFDEVPSNTGLSNVNWVMGEVKDEHDCVFEMVKANYVRTKEW